MIDLILWLSAWYFIIGAALFVFVWLAFMFIMWGQRNWGKLSTYIMSPLLLVIGVAGWIGDVLWNVFYATLLFLQPPDIHKGMRIHDITLSHRLRQILRGDTFIKKEMIRWHYADILCKYFIEPHDCTHCGRNE